MKRVLFLFFVLLSVHGFSQEGPVIRGTIHNLGSERIRLARYYGEKTFTIDSSSTNASGDFSLSLPGTAQTGLYRLSIGRELQLDLVINGEPVAFTTDANALIDSLVFTVSEENKLYYSFLRKSRTDQSRLELLLQILDFYPVKDGFYHQAGREYELIQNGLDRFVDSAAKKQRSSYAVRMMRLQQTPFLSASLSKTDRMEYLRQHFFDRVDFSDTLLLHSNAWTGKAIAYLSLYSNNRLTQKQLEVEFIKAVTVMMTAAQGNPELYKFLLDYLITGFDRYHFEEVITYMADHFKDPFACEDQERKTALQKKLENFQKIAPGKTAPEIEVPDPDGKMLRLSGIQSPFTLVIFWASECGHCAQMMPEVRELYEKQNPKKLEVLTVSIDTSKSEWTTYLRAEKLNWLNGCDLKGFYGKAADDYNIYATPTMFLLDREKKILAKPITFKELERALKDFNVF